MEACRQAARPPGNWLRSWLAGCVAGRQAGRQPGSQAARQPGTRQCREGRDATVQRGQCGSVNLDRLKYPAACRARYMPQNPFIVATKSADTDVFIFDTSKHPSDPGNNKAFSPQTRLKGHDSEGYGMGWSTKKEGYLLSGSDDKKICMWNVAACGSNTEAQPEATFLGHTNVVEDVNWHYFNPDMFASVGDDKQLLVWDIRDATNPQHTVLAHPGGFVNCLHFNPNNEHLLVTGSEDKVRADSHSRLLTDHSQPAYKTLFAGPQTVALWDIRKLGQRLHTFETHTDEVFCVEWSPFSENILASASSDRR